jgi:signal transduction histidine kinase
MESGIGTLPRSDGAGRVDEVAQLQAEIARLEAEVVARDNLLAVAAHELRNPMHAILLLVTAALAIARRDQARELTSKLERIRHVVDKYVKRATLLLDSVRMDSGAWAADRNEFDLSEVVREICGSYEPEAQFAGSAVSLALPPTLRGAWDRLAVEQIVGNLVSNAIKYGQGSPVHITLDTQDSQARLTVRDHGGGIAEHDQQRIFERFQQAIGMEGRRSGFGIGLWLVRSLVEAHNGSIFVHSRLGEGSTFTVLLPGLLDDDESSFPATTGNPARP